MALNSDSDFQGAHDLDYHYAPLTQPGSIRLLRLYPATSGSEEVHFTLHPAQLNDKPAYEAISYCWGDENDTRVVFCDQRVLRVTVSLYTALKRLRHADRERILWADAVCINQKDDDEKGRQVQLMSHIYSQPTRVLIWLGEDMEGLEGLTECLRGAKEVLPPESHDHDVLFENSKKILLEARALQRLREEKKPNLLDHNWEPMNNLLCRPWFGRRWIIQEVVVADDTVPRVAICGDLEFPWQDLASVAYIIGSYCLYPIIAGLSMANWKSPRMSSYLQQNGRPVLMLGVTYMVYLRKHYRGQGNLLDCVVATFQFRCGNPADHLYSLLSLPRKPSRILPDCSAGIVQIYLDFAETTLVGEQDLKLLSLAPHTNVVEDVREDRLHLPSWVPDLSRQGEVQPLVSYAIRRQPFHSGGDKKPLPIFVSEDGGGKPLLHLRRRIVDRVEETAPCSFNLPLPRAIEVPGYVRVLGLSSLFRLRMMRWLQGCLAVMSRDIAQTLMCGMTGMRDPLPEEVIPAAEEYIHYVFDFWDPNLLLTDERKERLLTYGALIEHSLLGIAESRCLREARAGDVLCVIMGAEVPYVLRPSPEKEGRYTLIGDAYLHGMM
ncbi:heterokaryon incompatibility protein-domain-containing protein [Chaetomium strumarium]|uniref:Heterokaryon incompatibility protein-domain-containing protein n=1 Tax=Chaetomium strumarium TaxID=1170767 RepID=A0AAJ0LZA5_9PEZI|nr:heterokaryon incompatibility protein-domain-containing protein [Chaetomium strumarium]